MIQMRSRKILVIVVAGVVVVSLIELFAWMMGRPDGYPVMAIILIASILKLPKFDKEVELILDNCPPTFDFTEAGNMTVEEIDRSTLVMEKINKVD